MDMHISVRAGVTKCYVLIINRAVFSLLLLYFGFIFSRTGDLDEVIEEFRKYLRPDSPVTTAQSLKDDYLLKTLDMDPSVRNLLDLLKNASRDAPKSKAYTRLDRALWDSENNCKSRVELTERYERRKHVENIKPPMAFRILMKQYEELHRNCIRGSGNLTTLFLQNQSGNDNDGNGCKFLVAEAGNGLGNRVLWMVSTLLYAVLAGRVILIDPRSMIPSLMCEPFSGSSWVAPSEFPFADLRPDLWLSPNDFVAAIDAAAAAAKNGSKITLPFINAVRGDDSWGPTSRFYCPMEQHLYSKVKWVTLGGCLYFLPELFAIPNFRLALEATFQNRIPLTHLLRLTMLPRDSVWTKVSEVLQGHFSQADKLIGVHVRYRGGYEQYQNLNAHVNHNIHQCLLESGLLPTGHLPLKINHSSTLIFISSLYPGLNDELGTIYPQGNEENVNTLQLSSEGEQHSGLEIDEGALVEIVGLSLCDAILTSPMSTYSMLAHAYGGLTPWIINFQDDQGPCTRAQALDGCYQGAGVFYVCPLDPTVDKQPIMKLVPSLKPCQDSSGVQLVH